MLNYIISILVIILIVSCNSPNEPEDIKPNHELFPLSVGNYWIYEEEFISSDTTYSEKYTTTITEIEEIGDIFWYKLETPRTGWIKERFLMTENDSIFALQYNWQNPIRSLSYIIPIKSVQKFGSIMGGDVAITKIVYSLDSTITTNVGDFENCLMFEYSSPDWIEREILAYGVGIIEKQMIGYSFVTGEKRYTRIEKLIDYRIN